MNAARKEERRKEREREAFARRALQEYRVNKRFLEDEKAVEFFLSGSGSRAQQHYDGQPIGSDKGYVDSVPSWLQGMDRAELVLFNIRMEVMTLDKLLEYLQKRELELYVVYELAFDQGLPTKEAKKAAHARHGITPARFSRLESVLIRKAVEWLF